MRPHNMARQEMRETFDVARSGGKRGIWPQCAGSQMRMAFRVCRRARRARLVRFVPASQFCLSLIAVEIAPTSRAE
jgi:hypothetical protein